MGFNPKKQSKQKGGRGQSTHQDGETSRHSWYPCEKKFLRLGVGIGVHVFSSVAPTQEASPSCQETQVVTGWHLVLGVPSLGARHGTTTTVFSTKVRGKVIQSLVGIRGWHSVHAGTVHTMVLPSGTSTIRSKQLQGVALVAPPFCPDH